MGTERRVLVIYTGGTIGMMKDAETGALAPINFERLREMLPEVNQLGVEVEAVAFDEPIDSGNMDLSHWTALAKIIEQHYEAFDGFVILHGSDTMAFTAAALSFMLINLSKPVILTGSQLPIGMVRTDGRENVITSVEIAAAYDGDYAVVPEVAVYFESELYRGNRTYKRNTQHFQAFQSPNYPVLAEAGVRIKYRREFIRTYEGGVFRIDPSMDNRIAVLTLFPGISEHIVEAALNVKNNKALIIRTYGSGNAMSHPWFIRALTEAGERGLILINSTQCRGGGVSQGTYETSTGLVRAGLISAGDMMLEAALVKAMYLMGSGLEGEDFKKIFQTDLRGEMTVSQY